MHHAIEPLGVDALQSSRRAEIDELAAVALDNGKDGGEDANRDGDNGRRASPSGSSPAWGKHLTNGKPTSRSLHEETGRPSFG